MLRLIKRLRFIKNKPILIPIILKNYFKLLVLRQKALRSVELHMTSSCQCKCTKCSAANFNNPARKRLSVQDISRLVSDCYKLGAINIGITGGEPLEDSSRLFDILKVIKPWRAIVNVSTTGLLLTEEIACRLKRSRTDAVFISIDSASAEEHDKGMGISGCFDKSTRALKIAKEAGLIVTVNTVFTHELISSKRYKLLMDLVKRYNASWNLIYPCFTGGWIKDYSFHGITSEDDKIIKQIEAENIFARNDKSDNYLEYGCPAGVEKICITQYGDVIPCACVPISFGNVLEEPIEEIWNRMSSFPEFGNRSDVCNVSLNKDFIKKYLEPIKELNQFPMPIDKHPAFGKQHQ